MIPFVKLSFIALLQSAVSILIVQIHLCIICMTRRTTASSNILQTTVSGGVWVDRLLTTSHLNQGFRVTLILTAQKISHYMNGWINSKREMFQRWQDYFRHLVPWHTATQVSVGPIPNRTPYLRCEVSCGGGCLGGVCVQSGSPDSAFVTQKRSYPVPCVSLAQHGLAIWQKESREYTKIYYAS